jgi:hypothetical protein
MRIRSIAYMKQIHQIPTNLRFKNNFVKLQLTGSTHTPSQKRTMKIGVRRQLRRTLKTPVWVPPRMSMEMTVTAVWVLPRRPTKMLVELPPRKPTKKPVRMLSMRLALSGGGALPATRLQVPGTKRRR